MVYLRKSKTRRCCDFFKQFATMVKAGLPILNVLSMLRDQLEHPELEIVEYKKKLRRWNDSVEVL